VGIRGSFADICVSFADIWGSFADIWGSFASIRTPAPPCHSLRENLSKRLIKRLNGALWRAI